VNLQFRLF